MNRRNLSLATFESGRVLSFFLFLFIICNLTLSPPANAQNNSIKTLLHKHGEVIVRVYFDDADKARKFGLGLEPMQSNYENGYLVFHLTQDEYDNLTAITANNGMRVELDQALNEKYITNRQLRLPQASATLRQAAPLQSADSQFQTLALEVDNYPTIPGFACYRTVEGTFQTAQDIVSNYPNLATWTDVGNTWEKNQGLGGYDLNVLKLTNSAIGGVKPKIFFTSAIHAREYTTAELMTRFAVQMVENYGVDADTTWMLDHHEIHLMLVANPDGRKFAETGLLWRKNTNQNYCGPTSNNRGADLNRNFDYQWGCCGGSSGNQCSATYRGASAASEPEAQAVMNYLRSNFADTRGPNVSDPAADDTMGIYIDVHSSGRLVLWPWGFTSNPAPNGTDLQTFGRKMAFFNGHTPQQSIGLYPTDGTTTSFAYGDLGLPAYTFELGTQFFESCNYFENTLLGDNLPALFYAVKAARAAYQLPGGPDVINQSTAPTSPTGVPAGTLVTLSATASDQRFNNSNGTEPTQNVISAEYFIDVEPWSGTATGTPMSASDGSFNSGVEGIEASIDTTGLSEGRHIVYIQATDSNGNTGVVSAVFLDIDNGAVLPTTIFSDDFESNQGWITNPDSTDTSTTGQWVRANPEDTNSGGPQQLGTTVSGVFDLVTGPLAGTSVGTHDIDNGVTSIRSPDIVLPSASAIDLSFYYYLAHLNNATSDDFFRASIVGSSTTQLLEELGDPNQDNASWQQQSFDITAFAGQTVYILFEAADAAGGSLVEAAVDDVVITAVLGNQPPQVTNPGDQTDAEGSAVSLQIVATDADDDTLSYSATGLPDGLSINSSTGLISGTITAAAQVFAVEVTVDDQTNTTSVNFNWTVTPDNDPPVVTNPGNQTNGEDDTVSLQIAATDADGDTLTYSAAGLPPGLSINASTGEISGYLDFDSAGTYNVQVTVSDAFFSPSVSFDWTVNNVNRAPSFDSAIGNQTNNEGDSVSLSASASDPDGDTLNYSATELPDGISINAGTGAITGTLSSTSAGSYTVEVNVSDGSLSDTQNFDWTVNNVNQPPVVTNPGDQTSQQTDSVNLQINATDADGDTLSYSASGLPADLSIDSVTGLISGTVTDATGTYPVSVTVTDGIDPVVVNFNWTVNELSICTVNLDFESGNGGWTNDASSTCTTGTFITGTPTEVVNGGVITQLAGDHTTGTGQALFTAVNTGAGTDDVDGGECSVQSPNYTVTQASDLSIWYFHGQRDAGDDASGDYFRLEYTLDSGSNWIELASNGDQTSNAVWTQATATIAADSTVRLRAVVSDGAGPGDLIEAGLDDLAICSNGGVNTPPSVTNPGNQTNQQSDTVSLQIVASDIDGDTLTFFATGLPAGLSINTTTGEIAGTITAAVDTYNVSVSVSDGQDSTAVNFNWTVTSQASQSWLESVVVSNVDDNWVSVGLSQIYVDPVAVCSVKYVNNTVPVVVRMRNLGSSSFDVRLQNPSGNASTADEVHCLVMESGQWTLADGRSIEAQHYTSTVTDENNSWVGEAQTYLNSYTSPVVLGQVMTTNDADWSTFWNRGASRSAPPTSTSLFTGKHVAEDTNITRTDEEVGFIVIEQGMGDINGVAYEAALGADTVNGLDATADSYNFSQSFALAPQAGIVTMAAMDGNNGGWAVLRDASALTSTAITVAIDEDQVGDSERTHTTEQVGYLVLEFTGALELTPAP